jgi:hypothetical protein
MTTGKMFTVTYRTDTGDRVTFETDDYDETRIGSERLKNAWYVSVTLNRAISAEAVTRALVEMSGQPADRNVQ